MAAIQLDKLTKVYPDGTKAVTGLDLEIGDGEFVVFVGPSGCGKTTALRMIAGLEDITEGTVRIGDVVVNGLPPKDRDIAMIFQNYALYPHMSAFDNMAFGLKLRKVPGAERRSRVQRTATMLGLPEVLKKCFGFDAFRPSQEEVCAALATGRDVLLVEDNPINQKVTMSTAHPSDCVSLAQENALSGVNIR